MHRRPLLLLCLALIALTGVAFAQGQEPAATNQRFLPLVVVPDTRPTHTGEGTFYGATGAGNCSFDATPNDLMVAAMNKADYSNARLCGAFVEVSGPRGAVTVRIVDQCPECKPGDIDLSREAFARLADPVVGRIPIRWKLLSPANLVGPLRYRFKEGSSQYWTAVQIRNHRNPLASVERQLPNGSWKPIAREPYNYFVDGGEMGPGPFTLRVTDIYGNSVVDSGVVLMVGAETMGKGQFPVVP